MTDLPTGWVEVRTDEAGTLDLGRQRSPKYHHGSNMKPYLRVANVFEDRIDTSDVKTMHFEPEAFERSRLHVGDVLLNEGQSPEWLGRPAIYRGDPPDVAFTNSLIRFKPNAAVTSEWALTVFRHHMHSGRFTQESRITTNIAHLSANRLAAVEFRVPPLAEQKRIVTAIEEAFSKLDAGEAGLRIVRRLLKRMREAILAAAVTGRLVPQAPADTPATKLLADVGAEPLAGDVNLPETWCWARVGDLLTKPLANGRSVRSHTGGFPVLRLTCLRNGRIDLSERKDGEWTAVEAAQFLVQRGDFLVSRGNGSLSLVGRGGLVDIDPDAVAFPDTLIRVQVSSSALDPSLLAVWWNSQVVRSQLEAKARTTAGIYKVNQSMIADVRLPIPAREEQARIVNELARQLSFIEACERTVDAGLARSVALRRSVLKAAFEGHLVPQDPSDEPASMMLERIRAQRAAGDGSGGSRRGKRVEAL